MGLFAQNGFAGRVVDPNAFEQIVWVFPVSRRKARAALGFMNLPGV
jgi:hypothetical protein